MHSNGSSRRGFGRLVGAAALGACFPACLPDGRLKRAFDMTPRERHDGLTLAKPSDVGLDPAAVERAYRRIFDEDQLPNIRSMLVLRHGRLVAEGYVADARDVDRPSALMSATKSVTSTLVGIALERGELSSLDVSVGELFADKTSDGAKRAIRLRDTLTMRAGIEFSNDDFSTEMAYGGVSDSVAHILGKRLADPPGTKYSYTDASAHLAGALLQRALGTTLDQYARDHLFGPLGIDAAPWLHHQDGLAYGAYGLFLKPRDFLRLGAGILRAFRGEDESVVPSAWLHEAASFKVQPDFREGFDYGYFWWVADDGSAFTASGHGGQFAYSVPELDLEVVVTADPNSNGEVVAVQITDVRELVDTLSAGAR